MKPPEVKSRAVRTGRVLSWPRSSWHSEPGIKSEAVEVPEVVAKQLGLDEGREFINCAAANSFIWPSTDLHPVPRRPPASYVYGVMSARYCARCATVFWI